MMPTPAQQFSEFAHSLRFSDIPQDVRDAATRSLIDLIGVGLASHSMPFARIVTEVVTEWGGVPESTVWGSGERLPAPNAIIANGNMAHGIDYDDTHGEGLMHPSACVIPAALAVAEKAGASGEELLTAIIVGEEVQTRIASAGAREFHAAGHHPTMVTGSFSTSLVAGKLLGLTVDQMTNAQGICGTQAAGSFEWLQTGAWSKRFGPGWAGHAGTIAAQLAQRGYTGPETIYEGRFGLFRSHLGEGKYSLERLLRGLGDEWETRVLMIKRYPACHANHNLINSVKALRQAHDFDLDDIVDIECFIQPDMARLVSEPQEVMRRPRTPYQAQFSLYYNVAVALLRGHVDLEDFTEDRLTDPAPLALTPRIRCTPHDPYTGTKGYPATMVIQLRDGRVLRHEDGGDLTHPVNYDDVADKFRRNAAWSLPGEQVERLLTALTGISSATNITDVMQLTAIPAGYQPRTLSLEAAAAND